MESADEVPVCVADCAVRSPDPVLAKVRLMWVFTVWLLRNRRSANVDVGGDYDDGDARVFGFVGETVEQ